MYTKTSRSQTEKETDMPKQLGCMNGIFQLFGRQNFLPSRRVTGHKHRKLAQGQKINHGMEKSGAMQDIPGSNLKQAGQVNIVAPVEPSRTSFSSSCSSSTFSSVNWNKKAQAEPLSSCRSSFLKTTSTPLPMKQPCSFSHLSLQSLDLRDIVKNSMSREPNILSVNTNTKDKGGVQATKYIDSPRPFQQHKSAHTKVTRNDGSLRNVAKSWDAPHNGQEQKYCPVPMTPRDAPRYSYDERVSQDKLKSSGKLKQLPRLSLGSRESAIRGSASQSRSNYLSRETDEETGISSQILCLNEEPGRNKRPSTVVARLMGLEPTPNLIPPHETHISVKTLNEEPIVLLRSSGRHAESKQNQVTVSPRITQKLSSFARSKNDKLAMKSTSSSKMPLEPAPWKQTDSNQFSLNQALKYQEAPKRSPPTTASVYGEIETKLTELEFKKSGKDLGALKQILKAMEKTRERSENKEEEKVLHSESRTRKCSVPSSYDLASIRQRQSNNPILPIIKASGSPKQHGSPFVIMKPNKQTEKPANPTEVKQDPKKKWSGDHAKNIKELADRCRAKDVAPKKNQLRDSSSWLQSSNEVKTKVGTLQPQQQPKVPLHIGGENPAGFGRGSRNLRERLQKQKGTHKLSCATTKPSESRRSRNQSIMHAMESGSPTRNFKKKTNNLQKGNDHLSWSISEARNLNNQSDTVSKPSESYTSLASDETEVISKNHTKQVTGCFKPKNPDEENFRATVAEDRLLAELAAVTLEQPSPVSILDIFYEEDFPSPVKKRPSASQDHTLNSDKAEWGAMYIDHLQSNRRFNSRARFDQANLENIDQLVQKLQPVTSTQDEATKNCIESVCDDDDNNSEHRYIKEILVIEGLLMDHGSSLTTIQLHSSKQPLNPKLFHILEKAMENTNLVEKIYKQGARSKASEKIHRKLLFDDVNEIFPCKSALTGSIKPWNHHNNLAEHNMRADKLLKKLCCKMNHQQATQGSILDADDDGLTSILSSDMVNELENWALYTSELPVIVLDIERLIFKDLIGEMVCGGATCLPVPSRRHCRKLFHM